MIDSIKKKKHEASREYKRIVSRLKKLRSNQTFQGLLDTGSVPTLLPEESKPHSDPPCRVRAHGGHVISGGLLQAYLTVCLVDP